MSPAASDRTTNRGTFKPTAVGLLAVAAAIIGTVVDLHGEPASSSAPLITEIPRRDPGGATTEPDSAVTRADGALPDATTAFDDEYPGVANLDHDLLQALRDAAAGAADEGIDVYVNSGWRSPEYQDQLLREAISEYGSAAEAARWVATADTSPHVTGDAVDVGSFDATSWLSEHGAAYEEYRRRVPMLVPGRGNNVVIEPVVGSVRT